MRTHGKVCPVRRLLVAVVLLSLITIRPVWGFELKWGTAPAGGFWAPLGAAMLEKVKEENPGITGTSLPGPGGHNFLGIQSGRFNIAFATTDASFFVWAGKEIYTGKSFQGFRNVTSLVPMASQYMVWADSDIKSIPDLVGKKVSYGRRGSGSELNVRKMLELYGILDKVQFEYLSFSDISNRLKDRLIDATLMHPMIPYHIYIDLSNTRPIRLLPFSDDKIQAMLAWNQGLERYTVPGGLYKGVDKPLDGYAYRMHLIAAQDVPDEVVYKVTKTLVKNLPHFQKTFKPVAGVTVEDMAKKLAIPFHPGAVRYYKEINMYRD